MERSENGNVRGLTDAWGNYDHSGFRALIADNETRCIATSADANYFPALMALLRSVKKYNPSVPVIVFDGGFKKTQIKKILRFASIRKVDAPLKIEGRGKFKYIGNTTLLKLYAGSLEYDKVLFMDADMVVLENIECLFDLPPGTVAVVEEKNTVRNMFRKQHREKIQDALGIDPDQRGFNAGLFVIRTSEWKDLPEKAEALVNSFGKDIFSKTKDQQLLNIIFRGRLHLLPQRYNFSPDYDEVAGDGPAIVHYLSECKPWHFGYTNDRFYRYFRTSLRASDYILILVTDIIKWWRRITDRLHKRRHPEFCLKNMGGRPGIQ